MSSTRRSWYVVSYATTDKLDPSKHMELREEPVPELKDGEIMVKAESMALEPTMRNSLSESESYRPPTPLNTIMWAFTVGKVVASKASNVPEGTWVVTRSQMSTHPIVNSEDATVIPDVKSADGKAIDRREFFSAFGPPGLAAYVGLHSPLLGNIKEGEPLVIVTGAAGATGRFVIQMAKAKGAKKIVGVASSRKKDAVLKSGADEFVAYDSPDFEENLKKVTNREATLAFENAGGPVLESVLLCLKPYARVALCGLISEYDASGYASKGFRTALLRRISINGFICADPEVACNQQQGIMQLLQEGKISSEFHEHTPGGIENVPYALLGLFSGKNTGKMTVAM